LKEGDCFGVFDVYGDIQAVGLAQGLFLGATRFLSAYDLRLEGNRMMLLSSTIRSDNMVFTVDLMNREMVDAQGAKIKQGDVHVFRSKFLWENVCYERIRVTNYSTVPVKFNLGLHYEADFGDIFQVRGMARSQKGIYAPAKIGRHTVRLGYRGLDSVERTTMLSFRPTPDRLAETRVEYDVELAPKEKKIFYARIACELNKRPPTRLHRVAQKTAYSRWRQKREGECVVLSSNAIFNEWIKRSQADLHLMVTQTAQGPYPFAGVPWFNTVFGRDGIITALQSLWFNPEIARGVLSYLAATQCQEDDPACDAEPGKILHEVRSGEMVATGEVPFRRYYGTADATPLFVCLAGAYLERTGNLPFIESIWPQVKAALQWAETYGDPDGDGLVEYLRRSKNGLTNQGWKDSGDCISHSDGRLAEGPIALCEIQGYVFAARKAGAVMARHFGDREMERAWLESAERIRFAFESQFWNEKLQNYVLALDGDKRQCAVMASNSGHCLFSGIASPERARLATESLMHPSLFSGWGIRTLGIHEHRYNPMSYHNGSVWPHDTALIADGFARYGQRTQSLRLLNGLYDASVFMDLHRLPELFCGFDRRPGEGPTLYPVACSPQAWAAGSLFMILRSCLGLTIHSTASQVHFYYPTLPRSIDWLQIKNLKLGAAEVDLVLTRHKGDVGLNILRRFGQVEVAVIK
jgi:glycogen debranching enzyme